MNMTIAEIREVLRHEYGMASELFGDPTRVIKGFSDPRDYRADTVIWVGKPEDVFWGEHQAVEDIALILAKPGAEVEKTFPNVLITNDPKNAFMKLVMRQCGKTVQPYVDITAAIAPSASIGQGCYIGRNVVIGDNAKIGPSCEIRENTYIGAGTVIGEKCIIGQNCVIAGETNGSIFEDTDGIMKDMPNIGIVRIGKYVRIGAGSIIARATFTETVIDDECEINAGTSLGHNVKVGKRVQLLGRNTISGNTHIGDNSQLISCCVKNRIVIGKNVKCGIGSVVLQNIPDNKTCFGNPARIMPN